MARLEQQRAALRALQTLVPGGLRPGQVGALVAQPGVGKTQLLIYTALDRLLAGGAVLHVAVRESVATVRDAYDSILAGLFMNSPPLERAESLLQMERRRLVHSTRGAPVTVARLENLLDALAELVGAERHDLVVVDGEALTPELVEPLQELARRRNFAIWFAWAPDALHEAPGDVVLELAFERGDLWLRPLRGSQHDAVRVPRGSLASPEPLVAPAEPVLTTPESATLYSGGAHGTEAAFGAAAQRYGLREVNFTFDGHVQARTRGAHPLTERELAEGDVSLAYVSRRLRRSYTESAVIRRVLQSLWHMVKNAQIVFVVGTIQEDGTVTGGTGWSVELARMWNKRLWVFDQEKDAWYRWVGDEWQVGTPVIDSPSICGTGTRYLADNGKAAIELLFQRSFGD